MKRKNQKIIFAGAAFTALFVLWTVLLHFVDVKSLGPNESAVGFATLNGYVHEFVGTNMFLYHITDALSIIPILIIAAFGILGLVQAVQRKSIKKVDRSILLLGVFYIVVMSIYVFFEIYIVNYRPILINGILEASYPSSTTMLVMCVMPTAIMQLDFRFRNKKWKSIMTYVIIAFTVFMVVGRIFSGVHWFTDIIGGAFISTGLVMMYYSVTSISSVP